LGRKTQSDPVSAYEKVLPGTGYAGGIGVFTAFLILSYYSVIGGWITKYLASYATSFAAPDFGAFVSGPVEPVVWHLVFMALTVIICLRGVKGIEGASKFMMPLLFVLLVVVMVRSLTLPDAFKGLEFMFSPVGSTFNFSSISAALGQVFYSLSLCMGITITYGSYLSRKENIPKSCMTVTGLDTGIALMAGLAIFPAVFSFGLKPEQGPSLVFGTLPNVFSSLQGGTVFAILFFLLVLFAALTSAIALLEVVTKFIMQRWGWGRTKSVIILGVVLFLLGIPSALSFGPLAEVKLLGNTFFDWICLLTDNILLPVGGILMCVLLGWKWDVNKIVGEVRQNGVKFRLAKAWVFCIRYVAPVLVLVVTVSGIIGIVNAVS
ncbi:MAG: sodium-dependent transporter, partial [Christensenellaceae bacterium]|nr:sodium-dependent transporter [Christensenellaceae bacterium]